MYMEWDPKVQVVLDENSTYFSKAYKKKLKFLENENNYTEITDLWYNLPDEKANVPEYFVFLDLGTDGMTSDRYYIHEEKYIQRIPNIVRMAALVCSSNNFYENDYDSINFTEYNIVCHSQNSYASSFLSLYYKYRNPLFLCHNGYRFDFSILFGNLLRFEKSVLQYLKCADTLHLYKHNYKSAGPLGNADLFSTYCHDYSEYKHLYEESIDNPNAMTRCKMLTLWTHNVELPMKNYSIGLEFFNNINYSKSYNTDSDSNNDDSAEFENHIYSDSSDYSDEIGANDYNIFDLFSDDCNTDSQLSENYDSESDYDFYDDSDVESYHSGSNYNYSMEGELNFSTSSDSDNSWY